MVVDKLENFEKYASLNPLFADVVAFLKATDLNTHELGKMTLKEGELTVNFAEVYPKSKEEVKLETHNDFIDIQVPLSGIEQMGYTPRADLPEEEYNAGKPFPIDLKDQAIYYAGPCPAKPGEVIGSCGPTTAGRMDAYTPLLLDNGLSIMIGKGARSKEVTDAIIRNCCIYLGAICCAGALIAQCIKSAEVVCYDDLGTEAIRKLVVKDLPLTVLTDCNGNDLYKIGIQKYKKI